MLQLLAQNSYIFHGFCIKIVKNLNYRPFARDPWSSVRGPRAPWLSVRGSGTPWLSVSGS